MDVRFEIQDVTFHKILNSHLRNRFFVLRDNEGRSGQLDQFDALKNCLIFWVSNNSRSCNNVSIWLEIIYGFRVVIVHDERLKGSRYILFKEEIDFL